MSLWSRVREHLERERPSEDPAAVLRERAVRLAARREPAPRAAPPMLEVSIGVPPRVRRLWLPFERVRAVAPARRVTPLPATPPVLLGLTRWLGALVPVFDPVPLFDATPAGGADTLVVLGEAGEVLALLAHGARQASEAHALGPLGADEPALVLALGPSGQWVIDVDALLADPRLVIDQRAAPSEQRPERRSEQRT